MTIVTSEELARVNAARKRSGKRALTLDQAQTAADYCSAIDLNTLLLTYVAYEPCDSAAF
jgi:hypothetical protein